MAIYIYLRVSTIGQHFAQQMQDINNYFDAHGIRIENVTEIVEEKESGGKSYEDRKLQCLLNKCKPGDTIYAASTDRLGRNFVDMIHMMEAAKQRGITIVACKQGLSLDDDNMATKIILSVTAIIDEDERMRIRHRVRNGVSAALTELSSNGERLTKRGTIQKHWGNAKGCDMSAANEAASMARQDAAISWRKDSKGYKWVCAQVAKGKSRALILEEFNELHLQNPEDYCTREGKSLSKGVLSKWIRQMNFLT